MKCYSINSIAACLSSKCFLSKKEISTALSLGRSVIAYLGRRPRVTAALPLDRLRRPEGRGCAIGVSGRWLEGNVSGLMGCEDSLDEDNTSVYPKSRAGADREDARSRARQWPVTITGIPRLGFFTPSSYDGRSRPLSACRCLSSTWSGPCPGPSGSSCRRPGAPLLSRTWCRCPV